MAVFVQRNMGLLVLAIWLILYGLSGLVSLGLPAPLLGILALIAGVLILAGRWRHATTRRGRPCRHRVDIGRRAGGHLADAVRAGAARCGCRADDQPWRSRRGRGGSRCRGAAGGPAGDRPGVAVPVERHRSTRCRVHPWLAGAL